MLSDTVKTLLMDVFGGSKLPQRTTLQLLHPVLSLPDEVIPWTNSIFFLSKVIFITRKNKKRFEISFFHDITTSWYYPHPVVHKAPRCFIYLVMLWHLVRQREELHSHPVLCFKREINWCIIAINQRKPWKQQYEGELVQSFPIIGLILTDLSKEQRSATSTVLLEPTYCT